jgi:hypothetical protein
LSIDNDVSRQEVIGLFSLAVVPQVFERQKATMHSPLRRHCPANEPKTHSAVRVGRAAKRVEVLLFPSPKKNPKFFIFFSHSK